MWCSSFFMWLTRYVMWFYPYVMWFSLLKQCHFHFRCQTVTQALLILKNRLNQFLESISLGYNGGDKPTRLPRSCFSRFHNFALTSLSVFKDLPFFSIYDINGGSSKISLSNGCFLIKCHLFLIICFKLGTDWLVLRYKGQDSFISSAVLEGQLCAFKIHVLIVNFV